VSCSRKDEMAIGRGNLFAKDTVSDTQAICPFESKKHANRMFTILFRFKTVHALASCRSSPPFCSSTLPHIDTTAYPLCHPPFPLKLPSNICLDKGETTFRSRPFDSGSRRRLACRTVRISWWTFWGLVWRLASPSRVSSCLDLFVLLNGPPLVGQRRPLGSRFPADPRMTHPMMRDLAETRVRLLLLRWMP
jgi:hypothetical protein